MKTKTSVIFIFIGLLLVIPLISQDVSHNLKVVTEQANIRVEPDIGSRIIHQAPQNTSLESIGKLGEWYQVRFITDKGTPATGYVHESLVIEIGAPPPKIKQEEVKPEPKKTEPEKIQETIEVEKVEPEKIQAQEPEPEKKPDVTEREDMETPRTRKMPPISLLLSLGISYRAGGDINTGAKGLEDFYADSLSSRTQDTVSPVHLSYLFGGEVQMRLHPQWGLGLGLDYFKGKKESTVAYPEAADPTDYTTTPELQSVPLRLSLSYYILPSLSPSFYVKAGIEYHFASCGYFYRLDQAEAWEEWKGEASAQGFGFMLGLGIEMDISSSLRFFAEAAGNYAKISDFSGTTTYRNSDGMSSSETGSLYIYQAHTSPETSYPVMFIRERQPSEAGVSDVQLATLNYSGLWLRAGIPDPLLVFFENHIPRMAVKGHLRGGQRDFIPFQGNDLFQLSRECILHLFSIRPSYGIDLGFFAENKDLRFRMHEPSFEDTVFQERFQDLKDRSTNSCLPGQKYLLHASRA